MGFQHSGLWPTTLGGNHTPLQLGFYRPLQHLKDYHLKHEECTAHKLSHFPNCSRSFWCLAKESLLTKTSDDLVEDLSSDNEALQIIFTIASLLITHYDQVNFFFY